MASEPQDPVRNNALLGSPCRKGKLRLVPEEPSPDTSSTNYRASSEGKNMTRSPPSECCEETNLLCWWGSGPVIWDWGAWARGELAPWVNADLFLPKTHCCLTPRQGLSPFLTQGRPSFLCNFPSLAPMYHPYTTSVQTNRREQAKSFLTSPSFWKQRPSENSRRAFGLCEQLYFIPQWARKDRRLRWN